MLQKARDLVECIDQLYDSDEVKYFEFLESKPGRRQIHNLVKHLRKEFIELFDDLRIRYAEDFAQRLFHDREMCGYISGLVVTIGYPGYDESTGEPEDIIERRSFPGVGQKGGSRAR